jgi:hypothetical protein
MQIAAILFARHRIRVAHRTINQHLRQRGLHRAAFGGQPRAFGRFEASRPSELWIGDVLVGPFVPYPRTSSSRRVYLSVLLDDYSRLILHARARVPIPKQRSSPGLAGDGRPSRAPSTFLVRTTRIQTSAAKA